MIEAASRSCLSTLALVFDQSDVRGINATAVLDHAAGLNLRALRQSHVAINPHPGARRPQRAQRYVHLVGLHPLRLRRFSNAVLRVPSVLQFAPARV